MNENTASNSLALSLFKISSIEPIGEGERYCLDTANLLEPIEGMLVGYESGGAFICSESHYNKTSRPKPFRVNVGNTDSIIWGADSGKRKLADLKEGDEIPCIDIAGRKRQVTLGRLKKNTRPLVRVTATSENTSIEAVVQDHQHVRFIKDSGEPTSVTDVESGDKILGYEPDVPGFAHD